VCSLAASWSKGENLPLLFSSPLSRAKESAEILSRTIGVNLETDSRLSEKGFGEGEGLTVEERKKKFPSGTVPGAEPFENVVQRAKSFLDFAVSRYEGREIVVVSHGGFINAVLVVADASANAVKLGNASVTRVEHSQLVWRVKCIGKKTFDKKRHLS